MTSESGTDGHGDSAGAVREPYRLNPEQWPEIRPLTYSFVESGTPPPDGTDLRSDDFVATAQFDVRGWFREVVKAWENVCGVELVEVSDGAGVDIRVGWLASSESDGRNGVLGQATTWSVENWSCPVLVDT